MSFVLGLHGTVAVALLCGLLFVEEAGVPLPFAPGELVLVAGGLLIASGGLNPFVFVPLAMVACVSGSMVGFSWAGLVGPAGLRSVAARIHREGVLERVEARVQSAGIVRIALTRLIPGLRIYTTLVAGSLRINRPRFLVAIVPATAVWVGVFVVLGAAVGLPVVHLFNQVQALALQGVILIAIGVGGYFAIRHSPSSAGSGLARMPRRIRVGFAAAIDVAVVASVVTGLLALARRMLGLGLSAGWFDGAAALLLVAVFYVLISRHGVGATVGEALLETTYISGRRIPLQPRALVQMVRHLLTGSPDGLRRTADVFRALGDPTRLRVVSRLVDGGHTMAELSALSGVAEVEVQHALHQLLAVGLVVAQGDGPDAGYHVHPALTAPLLDFLALSRGPRPQLRTLLPAEPDDESTHGITLRAKEVIT